MALKYTEKTIDHFTKPRNLGTISDANAEATEGSPACGDMVNYTLKINPETLIIEDIKFRSYGCASNIATASIATEMVLGKHIDEVKKMGTSEAANELGGLPPVKMHCSVLAINGIKAAIREFEKKIGRILDEKRIITEKALLNILRDVIHPKNGVNLVDNENIQRIRIDGQNIFIIITLEPDEEIYASNIHDEVMEHLESMKCTHEIMVKIESKTGNFI
ncbi:MAG: iron-sulfur cluster assembly scaffold protein [Candidatus Delongbacteria bacterium]|jgi:NifU-like protein involved in Fe-S cluster formation/metal-sulfur cluster biosynthetic enzyme|nr:iron-sulfur cluster assembly scaffold protein [Candidatus Delongbacteria bacterium]MDD4204991.1 iron-sulfur cluster assembly scaffold protein [Candidatus Delongbacteria bacterium]MDY0016862.1 iron-sulfur cluster assembly scaffold protein [Candidatus Delongbacteria bacterium]